MNFINPYSQKLENQFHKVEIKLEPSEFIDNQDRFQLLEEEIEPQKFLVLGELTQHYGEVPDVLKKYRLPFPEFKIMLSDKRHYYER